jgi:hypothetical protein
LKLAFDLRAGDRGIDEGASKPLCAGLLDGRPIHLFPLKCQRLDEMDSIGRSVLGCPDCGGVMWELDEEEMFRHVGHTYIAEVMSLALDENLRRALATALRALEERVALARKLYHQAVDRGHRLLAETWSDKAREFEREMDVIRGSIRRMDRIAAAADEPKGARAAE